MIDDNLEAEFESWSLWRADNAEKKLWNCGDLTRRYVLQEGGSLNFLYRIDLAKFKDEERSCRSSEVAVDSAFAARQLDQKLFRTDAARRQSAGEEEVT